MADEINFDGYSIVNTGGISLPVTSILVSGQPVLADNCVIIVSSTTVPAGGVILVPLPSASSNQGKVLILKNDHPNLAFTAVGFGDIDSETIKYIISDGSSWIDISP